jgi:transmembrane sensor
MKPQLSKNILLHFFAGQASPLQKKLIEEWLKDTKNKEFFYECMEEWEREHPQFLPNTDEALKHYLFKIENVTKPHLVSSGVVLLEGGVRKMKWLSYAAAVAILLTVGLFLNTDFLSHRYYDTTYGEVRKIELPDGSTVILNANSTLKISRFGFGTDSRDVFLEGEAEFSVVHTKDDKKFLVHTPDQLEVEVLGTEFIVYSRNRGSKVVLNKGKVLLRSNRDTVRQMLIKPGDVVTINKGIFKLKEKQPVQLHSAWKDHRFIFDKTTLKDVAFEIEENFGVNVQISDSVIATRELTGTYEAENVEDLLSVITTVLDVRISQRGKRIIVNAK